MNFLISHCKAYMLNQEDLKIELTPIIENIDEIVIIAGKYKTLTTGNNIRSSMIIAGFQNRSLGSEMGTIMKYTKKNKGLVTKLHFNVEANPSDTIKFRVNVYEVDNGLPTKSILNEPIYFCGTPTNGSILIDISDKKIYIKKDCFVTIELIEYVGMDGLFLNSAFLRSASYFRTAPEGNWIKAKVDLGFWAEIRYKK